MRRASPSTSRHPVRHGPTCSHPRDTASLLQSSLRHGPTHPAALTPTPRSPKVYIVSSVASVDSARPDFTSDAVGADSWYSATPRRDADGWITLSLSGRRLPCIRPTAPPHELAGAARRRKRQSGFCGAATNERGASEGRGLVERRVGVGPCGQLTSRPTYGLCCGQSVPAASA